MATDFETQVLTQLGDIKALCATHSQANSDLNRRVAEVEEKFKTQDTRHWVKSLVISAVLLIAHPVIRKLGWDV